MTRRELTEDSSAPELWAEIYLLREALRGPDGFATWKDAAINERVRRVRAEAALRTAHPPKDAGELPPLPEHVGYLGSPRDAIRPYAYTADQMRAYALAARTSPAAPSQELDGGFHGAYGDGYDAGFEAGKLAAPSQEAGDDAALLDWLEAQKIAYGFEDVHEGNSWSIEGPYRTLRDAIRAAMAATTSTPGEQA